MSDTENYPLIDCGVPGDGVQDEAPASGDHSNSGMELACQLDGFMMEIGQRLEVIGSVPPQARSKDFVNLIAEIRSGTVELAETMCVAYGHISPSNKDQIARQTVALAALVFKAYLFAVNEAD